VRKNSYKTLREKGEKKVIVTFGHSAENIFQIAAVDSCTVGSGYFWIVGSPHVILKIVQLKFQNNIWRER